MVKKIYEKPLAKMIELKQVKLICTSPLRSVNVDPNSEMNEYEDFE